VECDESLSMLSAHVDGELDPASARRLTAHLAACASCSEELRQLTELNSAIKAYAARYVAPDYLRHRIKSGLPQSAQRGWKWAKLPWAWINFGMATAFSIAFTVTAAMYMTLPSDEERSEQEVVSSHARSLMVDHLSDVVSTDQHTVKPWFTGKLDFAPTVYDFAAQGFPLVGGRLDYLNQRPVAAMAYRRHQHVLNLFVWPDTTHRDVPRKVLTKQGFHLMRWTQDAMQYWVVSDLNVQELGEFQGLLSAQIEKEKAK